MNPVIDKYGHKHWYDSDGELHREDGPAIEWAHGGKEWVKHGEWHREDGPAYESVNGYKAYYLEGIRYSEEEYWKKIKELNKCKLFKLEGTKIGWI